MGTRVSRVKIESDLLTQLSQRTQFTEQDLKSWHLAFLSECPNGRLSQREFAAIFRKLFPPSLSPLPQQPRNTLVGEDNFRFHTEFSQFIFRGFPACLDNTTNFAGFATVLSTICRGTTEDKSLWLFRVLDRKGMGTVSHADFVDAFVILISFIECVTGQEVGNSAELAKLRTDGIFDFLGKREEERVSSSELLNWIEGDEELKRHLDIFLSKV